MRRFLLPIIVAASAQVLAQTENAPEASKVDPVKAESADLQTPPPAATPPAVKKTKPPEDTKFGKISQIFRDKKKAMVTLDASVPDANAPSNVILSVGGGEACECKVEQVKDGKAMVDFADCSAFGQVKSGAAL